MISFHDNNFFECKDTKINPKQEIMNIICPILKEKN